jgi:hypothetical protein
LQVLIIFLFQSKSFPGDSFNPASKVAQVGAVGACVGAIVGAVVGAAVEACSLPLQS